MKREFAQCMARARCEVGLSQDEAADRIGVSARQLRKYERGDVRAPDTVADRAAVIYKAPELRLCYCRTECALGASCATVEVSDDISRCLLDVALFDSANIDKHVREWSKIFADGEVHPWEVEGYLAGRAAFEERDMQIRKLLLRGEAIAARTMKEAAE